MIAPRNSHSLPYKIFLAAAALVVVSTVAKCQFNDSIHHYLSYNTTGNFNRTTAGNSTLFSNLLKFSISRKTAAINTMSSYVYGRAAGAETNSDFSSTVDFDFWKPNKKIYYWGLGAFDKSFSLKINHRLQGGVGIGYTAVNNKNVSIVLSDGFLFERSDLTDAELGRLNYSLVRNSFRLKYHAASKGIITLDGNFFYQPSLSNVHDVIYKSTTTLSFKVRKWLSLNTALTYNRITKTEQENLLLTFGILIEDYFR